MSDNIAKKHVAKRVRIRRMPDTQDFADRYEHLRQEYRSPEEEKEGRAFIKKYLQLQKIQNPAERLRKWQEFSDTNGKWFYNEHQKSDYKKTSKDLSEDGEEEPDGGGEEFDPPEPREGESAADRDYRLRAAEVDQTYMIGNNSTIAMVKKNGRFDDVPENLKSTSNVARAIPQAVDPEFDAWLENASWDDVQRFSEDDRGLPQFQTLTTTLMRCRNRKLELVMRHLKPALGSHAEQPFLGTIKLPELEVKVITTLDYRLVLLLCKNILTNYCLKIVKWS